MKEFILTGIMEGLLCLIVFSGPIFQDYLTRSYLSDDTPSNETHIYLLTVTLIAIQISGSLISSH